FAWHFRKKQTAQLSPARTARYKDDSALSFIASRQSWQASWRAGLFRTNFQTACRVTPNARATPARLPCSSPSFSRTAFALRTATAFLRSTCQPGAARGPTPGAARGEAGSHRPASPQRRVSLRRRGLEASAPRRRGGRQFTKNGLRLHTAG